MQINKIYNKELKEEMQYTIHESGLRVYVFPKKGFNKFYAIYGTEYGSVDRVFQVPGEDKMTTVPDGIAHYLEHKMFEEEDGGNAFDRFSLTGASSNAFTSFDLTAYLFSCTDKFYENLDILLDFVNHPYFTKENVEKEQGIIGQEIMMYDDDPEWRAFFNTLTAMYHNNPVKIDIAGTVESISHITPELLYKCYKSFYNPANMALVMIGDIDIDEALKYVDKHLDASMNLGRIQRATTDEPKERVKERIEQKLVVSQPLFRIGFKDNDFETPILKKKIATDLILESAFGKSSDLYMELYEEGLVDSSFDAEVDISGSYGFTIIGGETKDPEAVYNRVKTYLDDLRVNGIPKADLDRARKTLISGGIRLFNSVENMGNSFMHKVFNGTNPLNFREDVMSVTDAEVEKRLKEHFDTGNCVLSVINPAEE